MANIIVPQRRVWTQQPQQPVGIDWSNPITRDLRDAWPLGGAGGMLVNSTGSSNRLRVVGTTPALLVVDNEGVSTGLTAIKQLLADNVSITLNSSRNYTWFFRTKIPSLSQMWMVSCTDLNAAGMWAFGCYDASGVFRAYSGNVSSRWAGNAGDVIAGVWQSWAVVFSGGVISAVYRDGKQLTPSGNTSTSSATAAVGVNVGGYGSGYWSALDGNISSLYLYERALSSIEVRNITANPWQIFARRDRRTVIDFGASGTTAVYADSALTYYVRSMLSSDSGVQYAIRNAIYKDDAVGYYLRNAIAQNNEVGYILRSAIAQDDAEAYKIRGLIQADDVEAYNVRGQVQTTDSETYSIRGLVQTDATANYDIQSSTSVASTSTASYSVRGSVSSDGASQYSVRGAIQSDSSAGYSVRASAYRDVVSSYAIDAAESVVYADLTTSYSIDGVAPACPTADQIAAAVVAAIQTTPVPIPSNVTHFNGNPTVGSGTPADPVRPA